ncbi:MAG: YbjN domain-containing protein [Pseudomonadota bacterium]|nr:YbjN domain-containing protein [Pseudomonadota bacterium]
MFFYGCNDEGKDCDDIQFAAAWSGYDVTVVDANRWNSKKRFGKAYIDGDGDPVLAMTVNIDYGVTLSNLDDTFKWWTRALEGFKEEVL